MQGREILIGVTGGIAAYKTAALVSQLVQAGAGVTVVMTEAAQVIGAATFEASTGRPVPQRQFGDPQFPLGAHIEVAPRAGDVYCPGHGEFSGKGGPGAC